MSHGHRDQLFCLDGKRAVREYGLAERVKSGLGVRSKAAPFLSEFGRGLRIDIVVGVLDRLGL
jgi:hypothetical protein